MPRVVNNPTPLTLGVYNPDGEVVAYPTQVQPQRQGGGVSRKTVREMIRRLAGGGDVCCPPVFAGSLAGPNFLDLNTAVAAIGIGFDATKFEGDETNIVILQSAGAPSDVTIANFSVVGAPDELQDVGFEATITDPDDGQTFRVFFSNPCGCCAFAGQFTFSQA